MRAPIDDRERYAVGVAVRRAVLGGAHVDRANAAQTDPTVPFQDLITHHAWGEIQTHPGLSRHTRSLLTTVMMVVLGCGGELRLHLRTAANNGVTHDEIQETLLQAAVYCGASAANHALHLAQTVFTEMDVGGAVKK